MHGQQNIKKLHEILVEICRYQIVGLKTAWLALEDEIKLYFGPSKWNTFTL